MKTTNIDHSISVLSSQLSQNEYIILALPFDLTSKTSYSSSNLTASFHSFIFIPEKCERFHFVNFGNSKVIVFQSPGVIKPLYPHLSTTIIFSKLSVSSVHFTDIKFFRKELCCLSFWKFSGNMISLFSNDYHVFPYHQAEQHQFLPSKAVFIVLFEIPKVSQNIFWQTWMS